MRSRGPEAWWSVGAARQARWRHLGGVRGRLGRRAWKRLARAPRWRVADAAIDIAWRTWLRHPDDEEWTVLSRWRAGFRKELERARAELLAAAAGLVPFDGDRAALVAFCVRHALAPDRPTDRAQFYVLTGQHAQRRALDPDGTQVATAYRAADERTRAALREALAGEGDLDVLRVVVAGTRDASRVADMSAAEREYLTGRLADRRDWAGLWELARELPVAEAARAVALIGPGWRPDRQRDRELHALLSEVSPGVLAAARSALCAGTTVRTDIPGQIVAGALSPNGRRLAVAVKQGAVACIGIYRMPGTQLVALHRVPSRGFLALAYASSRRLIAVDSAGRRPPGMSTRLYRCPDQGSPELIIHEDLTVTVAVTARRQGLATISSGGVIMLRNGNGAKIGSHAISEIGISAQVRAASDPGSGRIAVSTDRNPSRFRLFLVDARQARAVRVVATATLSSAPSALVLHGPDHVIVAAPGQVERWKADRAASQVERWQANRAATMRRVAQSSVHDVRELVTVAARNEVCALDPDGTVSYLDPVSLTLVSEPRELTGMRGTALWSAADSSCHALAGDGVVTVVTRELIAVQELADRPQAAWGHADATTVARAATLVGQKPAARPLYAVLAGALEHRLAGDVRLGSATGPGWARDDDVAIGDATPDEISQEAGA